ncbi:hypothetical protein HK104_002975, partial [Borealophlyctis nickersoniae]
MKLTLASVLAIAGATVTLAEVPQEHSHDLIVNAVRTTFQQDAQGFPDPIFALLGNAAAGNALTSANVQDKNPDNLQTNIADQTVTNCKQNKPGDTLCIARAIQFRALERNTGRVGQPSNPSQKQPVNAELRGIEQHQDPAAPGASATNKAIELTVAKRLVSIGIDPNTAVSMALETATFAPGDPNDNTGKGNACDTNGQLDGQINIQLAKDTVDPITGTLVKAGTIDCITAADLGMDPNNRSKRVPSASKQELLAAVGGAGNGNGNGNAGNGNAGNGNTGKGNGGNGNGNAGNGNAGNGNGNAGNGNGKGGNGGNAGNGNNGNNGNNGILTMTVTKIATVTICPTATA